MVRDYAIDVEASARSVQNPPAGIGRESRALEPLDVADRAERDHRNVYVEQFAVGQLSASQPPALVPLQRQDRGVATEVYAVPALQAGGDRTGCASERIGKRSRTALGECHRQVE